MLSGSLLINEVTEFIELEIGGDDAAHFSPQRLTQRDHRRANGERNVRVTI